MASRNSDDCWGGSATAAAAAGLTEVAAAAADADADRKVLFFSKGPRPVKAFMSCQIEKKVAHKRYAHNEIKNLAILISTEHAKCNDSKQKRVP